MLGSMKKHIKSKFIEGSSKDINCIFTYNIYLLIRIPVYYLYYKLSTDLLNYTNIKMKEKL
jgi:hypothetical protein